MTAPSQLPPAGGRSPAAPPPSYDWGLVGAQLLWVRFALFSDHFVPPTPRWEVVGAGGPGDLPPDPHPLGWEVGGAPW